MYTNRYFSGTNQRLLNPAFVKKIVQVVFFNKVSETAGLASPTNLKEYATRLKEIEGRRANYIAENVVVTNAVKRTLNRFDSTIRNYKAIIKYYTEINAKLDYDPYKNFDRFYEDIQNDSDLAAASFNHNKDTDAPSRITIMKNGKPYVVNKEDLRNHLNNKKINASNLDKGIPELNDYLIHNVINNNDSILQNTVLDKIKNEQVWKDFIASYWYPHINKDDTLTDTQKDSRKKSVNDKAIPIITNDGTVVIVVPDEYWATAKGIGRDREKELLNKVFNADKSNEIFEVFILSETKYKEMQELHKAFFNKNEPFPMIRSYNLDDDTTNSVNPLPRFLNTKGRNVVIDVYLSDLNTINNMKVENKYEALQKLGKYYKLINEMNIVPVLKANNEGINVFNSNTYYVF